MPVLDIDPQDFRWAALVESHPRSSVFHTPQWLEALRRTYGYAPMVFTENPTSAPLIDGIIFCRVNSWLTGTRLVSLPFSDHCDPLVQDSEALASLLSEVREKTTVTRTYAEVRPRSFECEESCAFGPHASYCFHALDLAATLDELHSQFHKNSIQRKIRRAEREHVVLEQGRSDLLLKQFYELLLLTRRRHHLPPQPFAWFRNLAECFGNRLVVRVARVNDQPIASILTLQHKQTLVYKYGCSDSRFHSLGGMPWLFWQAIQEAKAQQLQEFDFGRSDWTNTGLIRFKDEFGARKTSLKYWRYPETVSSAGIPVLNLQMLGNVLSHLPDRLFRWAGEVFYRHVG